VIWLIFLSVVVGAGLTAYFLGRSDGRHTERTAVLNKQVIAAERIANAESRTPTNRAELIERLREHGL
jgi:hypothetical protein